MVDRKPFRFGFHEAMLAVAFGNAPASPAPKAESCHQEKRIHGGGAPAAVTATAHKLARIVYHLLSTKEPYSESVLAHCDHLANKRAEIRLRKQAAQPRLSTDTHPRTQFIMGCSSGVPFTDSERITS